MNRKTACGGFQNTFLALNLSSISQKEKKKKTFAIKFLQFLKI
jgi:hypothetical protein